MSRRRCLFLLPLLALAACTPESTVKKEEALPPLPTADQEVVLAVEQGDAKLLQKQMKKGMDPNSVVLRGEERIPLLCWAAMNGRARCIYILLKAGADAAAANGDDHTALWLAADAGKLNCVKQLLPSGGGEELMAEAVETGNVTMLRTLLEAGVSPQGLVCISKGKSVPLLHAAAFVSSECTQLLLQHGAVLSEKDAEGHTVTDVLREHQDAVAAELLREACMPEALAAQAVQSGQADLLRNLLEQGVSPESNRGVDGQVGPSLLQLAVREGQEACAAVLLEAGASAGDRRLMMSALEHEHPALVSHLLRHGAEPPVAQMLRERQAGKLKLLLKSRENPGGVSPDTRVALRPGAPELPLLIQAVRQGGSPLLKILLEAGADAAATDEQGVPALHLALKYGDERCVALLLGAGQGRGLLHLAAARGNAYVAEMLLRAGADANECSEAGESALCAAAAQGSMEVMSMLLGAGAEVNRCGGDGVSPLHAAARAGNLPALNCLLAAGADIHARTRGAEGLTAVELAASAGRSACAIRLLQEEMPCSEEQLIHLYSLANRSQTYQPALTAWIKEHLSAEALETYCRNALGDKAASVRVSMAEQSLSLCNEAGEAVISFPCSTGMQGSGFSYDSGQTPTGNFLIFSALGEGESLYTIFKAQRKAGEWNGEEESKGDLVLSRVLCLEGQDQDNANTKLRQIYIHGTADMGHIGTPSSHGCIRMLPQDVVFIFPFCPVGTPVLIEK